MAGDIVAVLDAAGIRRAHVLGASLGGMVAQELAVTHSERVDGIPDARLVTFPDLGHLLFWEDPDGFTDAVTSFLLAGCGGQEVPTRHRVRSGAWHRTGTRAAVGPTGPAMP